MPPNDTMDSSDDRVAENQRLKDDARLYATKIAEEQSRLLATIESLPVGFLIVDNKNNILIKNSSFDAIMGISDMGAVLLRGDLVSLGEPLLRSGFNLVGTVERVLSGGTGEHIPSIMFGEKYVRLIVAPILGRGDAREITGATVLVEDVTEGKVFEQGRDEFFSIASHELRTPLTAIRGNASMLLEYYADKMPDNDMKEMVDDMLVSSERLIRIVNDFLDVSRLEQRRMTFLRERVNVSDTARLATLELSGLAKDAGLLLAIAEDGGSPCDVLADPLRVKQVLTNLLGNAIHYTKTGSVTVSFQREGNMVVVSVTDTGEGIRDEDRALLFRKFQQVGENIYARKVMSTGLGLYISKLMVEAMGGKIWLSTSAPGEGSTFCFSLPEFSASSASGS